MPFQQRSLEEAEKRLALHTVSATLLKKLREATTVLMNMRTRVYSCGATDTCLLAPARHHSASVCSDGKLHDDMACA